MSEMSEASDRKEPSRLHIIFIVLGIAEPV